MLATWAAFRLNLDLDLARHREEIFNRADANGIRLARLSQRLIAAGDIEGVQADVEAMSDLPSLDIAGIMDAQGRIVADSTQSLVGQMASQTRLAGAAALVRPGLNSPQHGEGERVVISAHPFQIGTTATGWALLEFDRTTAISDAQNDAYTQLRWMASAMALLSFGLWAVLHFGFAARLGHLAESVHAFGEGNPAARLLPDGSDEVGTLATAFSTMTKKLREREIEQARLEREVLDISENERRRIGHDLHDSLGQRLTAASMTANALVKVLQVEAPELALRADEIGRQLRETIAEARTLSHGLAPIGLTDDGLIPALSALAENTHRSAAVRCIFECPHPIDLSDSQSIQLYRIAQEAVNNALKHADASEIRIGLECRDADVLLEVEDDGVGFAECGTANEGIGLRVMRYRAKLLNGFLEIGAAPAGGTRVACHIPIRTHELQT